MRRLANPSHFLLTNRSGFAGRWIYHLPLREMSKDHAIQLVRQGQPSKNIPSLAGAPEEELIPIFDTVGGNPLALRLVVGQLHLLHPRPCAVEAAGGGDSPSSTCIPTCSATPGTALEDDTSFWQYRWSPNKEATLSPGGRVSGLPVDVTGDSLARLSLEIWWKPQGAFNQKRYTIHSLTRTFPARDCTVDIGRKP